MYRRSRGIAPHIRNPGKIWTWAVSSSHRPVFSSRERTHWIGGGWAPQILWTFRRQGKSEDSVLVYVKLCRWVRSYWRFERLDIQAEKCWRLQLAEPLRRLCRRWRTSGNQQLTWFWVPLKCFGTQGEFMASWRWRKLLPPTVVVVYWTTSVWESNPGGDEIFRTRPYRSWVPPSLLCNGYRVSVPG